MLIDTALLDNSAQACISLTEARARPKMENHPWSLVLHHGSMTVFYHRADGMDIGSSHPRDAVYTVISGHGTLVRDGFDFPFHAGDLLFVPANIPRHFTDLSPDFEAYGLLFGPMGGERLD